jgi:hypothetical protein
MRLSVLMFLAATGCATATPVGTGGASHPATVAGDDEVTSIRISEEPESMSAVFDAPPEKVWAAMPLVYAKLEVTGARVLDSNEQTYGVHDYTSNRLAGTRTGDFVRCGEEGAGQELGNMVRRRLSISTNVHGDPNGKTTISTQISGYAQTAEGTSNSAIRCASNGKLEKRIRAALTQLLAPSS